MKLLLMGCGGIGSWFCHFLAFGIRNHAIDCDVTLADGDMVEDKNLLYSNFDLADLGKNKAEALAKRYHFDFVPNYIRNKEDLKGFDLVVVATDDGLSRKMVFASGADWLDLRTKGRAFAVFAKGCKNIEEMVNNLDVKRGRESCQDESRLEARGARGVDSANIIAASIGYQMFLNCARRELSAREFRGYV